MPNIFGDEEVVEERANPFGDLPVDAVNQEETIQKQQEFSPAEGVGAGEAFLIGAGKGLTDAPRGIEQALSQVGISTGEQEIQSISDFQDKWLAGELTHDDINKNLPIIHEAQRQNIDFNNPESFTTDVLSGLIRSAAEKAFARRDRAMGIFERASAEQREAEEVLEPLREERPIATIGGEITGFAGPSLVIPGAAPTLPGRIGLGATTGAGIGAIAPTTGETPQAAAEQREEAASIGAAFGAAGPIVFKLAKGAIQARRAAKSEKEITRLLREAAPETEDIKNASRQIYRELDESGVNFTSSAVGGLLKTVVRKAKNSNVDDILTPKSQRVVDLLEAEIETRGKRSLTDIDSLRKKIQIAASSTDPQDARLGAIMLDEFDSFIDKAGNKALSGGDINAAGNFKAARSLWGRARKAETIEEAFEKADRQASGFENGLRIQLRQILNNKKRSRFFTNDELKAMDAVVKGSGQQNILKLIGRLGLSEGQSTSILGGLVGYGVLGPGSVVAGQISRKLAQKTTEKAARDIMALVRAGTNGRDIAKRYLSAVPKKNRSVQDLSELLLSSGSKLDDLLDSPSDFISSAAELAIGQLQLTNFLAASGVATTISEDQ